MFQTQKKNKYETEINKLRAEINYKCVKFQKFAKSYENDIRLIKEKQSKFAECNTFQLGFAYWF